MPQDDPRPDAATTLADPGAERVLVAEDDRATRIGLTELLEAWGYVAEGAVDGQEALEKVTTFRPSIVLSDLVMPRLDGLGLLKALADQLNDLGVTSSPRRGASRRRSRQSRSGPTTT